MNVLTSEQIQSDFRRLLAKNNLTYVEWRAIGESCTLQCGCALRDVDEDLEFAFKALGPLLHDPEED